MATARVTIPIDGAGRVVLPKTLRDRMGLQAGSEFEVIEEDNRIILKPVEKEPKLVSKDGVLVFIPDADFSKEDEDVVKNVREERDRKAWVKP
jgi:AbrB family looped-hinge helix DNA binding protein